MSRRQSNEWSRASHWASIGACSALLLLPGLACDADETLGDEGGGPLGCAETGPDPWADCVEAFEPAEGTDYNHLLLPGAVLGPPRGGFDVVSLGCGGSITLSFDGVGVVDGEGPDFIVFENPFSPDFPEPGLVEVSADGSQWLAFPCDFETLAGCAGVSPTQATEANGLDPTDPEVAGGDAFDLQDLGDAAPPVVRLVRITDLSVEHWGSTGMDWCDPGQDGKGGFDLDAVAVTHE